MQACMAFSPHSTNCNYLSQIKKIRTKKRNLGPGGGQASLLTGVKPDGLLLKNHCKIACEPCLQPETTAKFISDARRFEFSAPKIAQRKWLGRNLL
jgi:hypothetical protein